MEKLSRIQDKIAILKQHYKINEDANETHVDAEVIGLKIGDFVIITCPAEALVQIAMNVKKSPLLSLHILFLRLMGMYIMVRRLHIMTKADMR